MDRPVRFHALYQETGAEVGSHSALCPTALLGNEPGCLGTTSNRDIRAGLAASSIDQEPRQVAWRLVALGSAWAAGHNSVRPLIPGISLCLSRLCFSVVCSWWRLFPKL